MKIRLLCLIIILYSTYSCTEMDRKDASSDLKGVITDLSDGGSKNRGQIFTSTLVGTIGSNEVKMEVQFNGEQITGKYDSPLAQAEILLEGVIKHEEKNKFEIREYDQSGNHVGTFRGEMGMDKSYSGEWANKQGSAHAPFTLKTRKEIFMVSQPNQRSSQNIEIEFRTAKLESPGKSCQLIDNYLVLSGFSEKNIEKAINKLIKPASLYERQAQLTTCAERLQDLNFEKGAVTENAWSINSLNHQMISISTHQSEYDPEAKKTNLSSRVMNIDPQTGNQLSNADLLVEDHLEILNALISQKLSEKFEHDWGLKFEGLAEEHELAFFSDKVMIYFNPYELGQFAPGRIVLSFSYPEVESIINPDGPAAGYFPLGASAEVVPVVGE